MNPISDNLYAGQPKVASTVLVVDGEVDTRHGPILYMEDVSVSFDGFKALNNMSLYIDEGELRCLIGPNGAGKTTLMDVITGKTRPDSGSVFFGQTINLLKMDEPAIAQAGICRKFQKPSVFDALTVFENLELALKANKSTWHSLFFRLTPYQRDRINEVLLTIGLSDCSQQRAGILSHGQKQWLEIGMLLMQEPKVMLVDEPIAGMTHQEVERTAELLLSLQGKHSIVVVEHDMEFVRSIASKVTVLHEGSVLTEGTMDEVQNDPRVIQVYLGGGMLKIAGLDQYYGASHTLWDINLDIPKGGCICLMGRNGVGKTTLLKTIMGLIPAQNGDIYFNGEVLGNGKAEQRAALGIGYVPQGREIFPLMSVEENLKTGLRAAGKQGIKRIPDAVYETFPVLKQMLKRRGGDLSGGQQQQLAIGRALVLNPKLLILDEPTEGIQPNIISDIGDVIIRLNRSRGTPVQLPKSNPNALGEVHEAIHKISQDMGVTVLLVEQKLPFARKVADHFCIMDRGRIVTSGAMENLSEGMIKQYLTV